MINRLKTKWSSVLFLFAFISPLGTFGAVRLDCGARSSEFIFEALDAHDLQADFESKEKAHSSWWKIYEDSFPEEERADPKNIIKYHPEGAGVALRVRKGDETIGIAYFFLLEDTPVSYLTYLAVKKDWRGKSLGTQLFDCAKKETVQRFAKKGVHSNGMVWEVEIPDAAKTAEDKQTRERRLDYYKKIGGTICSKDYFVPPLSKDGEKLNMYLMMLRAHESINVDEVFAAKVTKAIHRQIFPDYWKSQVQP